MPEILVEDKFKIIIYSVNFKYLKMMEYSDSFIFYINIRYHSLRAQRVHTTVRYELLCF
jgi:hypothetical protein